MVNQNHHAEIIYIPCVTNGVYELQIKSAISAMFDHFGYVWADEAGLFSLSVYNTPEAAIDAMCEYAENLNKEG